MPCPLESNIQLVILRSGSNRGFAGGNNLGMRFALQHHADYVLLLNNDTIVAPDCLQRLVDFQSIGSSARIVAPLICDYAEPERVWFAGATAILALGYFQHRQLHRLRSTIPPTPIHSDYVTGCCVLIPAAVLRKVGLFDERFFAYFEDADLCLRCREQRIESFCLPASVIWHKESASTRKALTEGTTSPLKHYLTTRNRIAIIIKHATFSEAVMFFVVSNTLRSCFYFFAFLIRRRWTKMAWFLLGLIHGIRQKYPAPEDVA